MKDKVERLAKGKFEYEQPELLLSEEALSISVFEGEDFSGKFTVSSRDRRVMKGVVYSSCELLTLKETRFVGAENEITYTVCAKYAKPGELRKGEITIVSECGEAILPFNLRIVPVSCICEEGEIRDLFQFAGLAQNDWYEAKKMFFSERFERTVLKNPEEQNLYRLLKKSTSLDRAMEEFLVYSRKKAPIQIKTDKTVLRFEPGANAVMDTVTVSKDTWGYTDVTVETEGDFFLVSAKRFGTENFNGNRYVLEVVVDGATLAEGVHMGCILLKTAKQCVRIEVSCVCVRSVREREHRRHAFLQAEAKLFQRYFDFRKGKVKAGSYIAEAESIVELLLVRLQEDIFPTPEQRRKELTYQMYRAYLSLMGGKEKYAHQEIERLHGVVEREWKEPVFESTMCYLEAMRQKRAEEVRVYAARIRELSERYPGEGMLLWYRLYTDRRNEVSRPMNLAGLQLCYEKGNRSPLFYYEVASIWNEEPALLKELGLFELQVLRFALKNKLLKKEVVMQFALLALQAKNGGKLLRRCLVLAYNQYGQRDVLQALCTILIAEEAREKKYHRYFAEACEAQLRIPGLQEYYIYTYDEEAGKAIDQSVLLYFVYGNELEEPYCGYLYGYVVRNKESLGSFYRTYLKRMEQYAVTCVKEGRIDKNLAIIYKDLLREPVIDGELAAMLSELVFSYEIRCDFKEMATVSVLHKEEEEECITPFQNGRAVFRMYTEDAGIVLKDREGNCYLPSKDCKITRLLPEEEWLSRCYELTGENRMLLLNLLEKKRTYRSSDADTLELSKRVVRLPGLREDFRQAEIYQLIQYCYDNYQGELLDGYLAKVNLDYPEKDERNRMIELLIVRGRYDLALDGIRKFGMEGISIKRILRLCGHMMLQCGNEQNDMLLDLCRHVFFEGRYDEDVVQYLISFFNGTTREMYRVWQAAEELQLPAESLEERLLAQILFAESYVPEGQRVFSSYSKKRGNPLLLKAYISNAAYRFFMRDCSLSEEVFDFVLEEAKEENTICCLAVLKAYSEAEKLTEEQKEFAERRMRSFAERGEIYPFFTKFSGKVPLPACMEDKVYVEYHTAPDRQVKISYLYDGGTGEQFCCEEMQHVGYGVFCKEFILFYGEVLQYYIAEEREEGRVITESFFRKIDEDKVHDETTKYGQINLILTAQDMKDEKTMMEMLENYFRMEYTINCLFAPIKE